MTPMLELLKQLRLSGLSDELPWLIEEARQGQLSYEAFLTCVLQQELASRTERADQRRLRKAKLPFISRVEALTSGSSPRSRSGSWVSSRASSSWRPPRMSC